MDSLDLEETSTFQLKFHCKKQSRNYHKARKRYARKHLRVSRQRKDFVKSVALRLVKSNDLIAYLALSTSVRLLIRTNHTRTLYL